MSERTLTDIPSPGFRSGPRPGSLTLRHWRLAAFVVLAALMAAVLPARTGMAQASDEAGDLRAQLTSQRANLASRLGDTEAALNAANQAVVATEQRLGEMRTTLVDVRAAIDSAEIAREEPLAVRRAIAIEVYMAGDPAANSVLQEIAEGNAGIEGVADRALYNSVVDWATGNLDRLDAELERLNAERVTLEREIPETEELLLEQQQTAADELEARDALVVEIEELDRQIRNLNRSILTGLPADNVHTRPILIIKIDNVRGALPQQGVHAADIVVEERVEAGLSRLAALFQSTGSDPVGPVRSARTSDIHLFANLGAPLFAYSGANAGVGGALGQSTLVDVGANRLSRLYYREPSRRAPHNLYSRTSALWSNAPGGSPAQAIFEFRHGDEPIGAGARPASGVDLTYGNTRASFSWSPEHGGWLRSQDGRPHMAVGAGQLAPTNVVIRFVDYVPSPADHRSPEAVVTGSGELWVLTDGQVVTGRWEQPSLTSPTRWLDSEGNPIRLTPGRTWIALPAPGDATLR